MRVIDHPNVVPCPDYPYGALQAPTDFWRNPATGNWYATIDGRVFDVHPFDDTVQGWPIRWELDEHQKAVLAHVWIGK